jgi:hypothetical protein
MQKVVRTGTGRTRFRVVRTTVAVEWPGVVSRRLPPADPLQTSSCVNVNVNELRLGFRVPSLNRYQDVFLQLEVARLGLVRWLG